jgi:hypothetical protein
MKSFQDVLKALNLTENIVAKVVSLLLSVALWGYLASSKTGEISFRIPIITSNLPENMLVTDISNKSLIAVVQGRKEYLKNVNVKNIKAVVNLSKPVVGKALDYPVEIIKNEIPVSIKVIVKKKTVKILVERKIAKNVAIIPRIIGKVTEGRVIGKYSVDPETIIIKGPRALVSEINHIYTKNISVDGMLEDIDRIVELEKDPDTNVIYSETKVRVTIPIIDYGNLLSLNVPVKLLKQSNLYRYNIVNRSVKVYIKVVGKKRVLPEDISVTVDVSPARLKKELKNIGEEPVTVKLPVSAGFVDLKEGMEIIVIVPETVEVKVSKKTQKE